MIEGSDNEEHKHKQQQEKSSEAIKPVYVASEIFGVSDTCPTKMHRIWWLREERDKYRFFWRLFGVFMIMTF